MEKRYYRAQSRYYREGGYGTTASLARQYLFTAAGRAVLPLGERYYRPSGTTAMTAVLPHIFERVGVISRQGEFQLPHTHSLLTPTSSLSLPLKNAAGGPRRISSLGHSPRIPTGGIAPHLALLPWMKVSPQIPSSFCPVVVFRFWGDACCSSVLLVLIHGRLGCMRVVMQ